MWSNVEQCGAMRGAIKAIQSYTKLYKAVVSCSKL